MKRNLTVVGLLLVILLAGGACRRTWRDGRDMNEHAKMIRMRMAHRWWGYRNHFMGRDHDMHGNFRQGMGFGMRGMGPGMGFGMRGMGRMPMDSLGWMPMAPGLRILGSIPNVTDNQKKQIEDLIKTHQDEMKKLREEMSSKMQSLMDSHRKAVLNILTEDQKKFLETRKGKGVHVNESGKQNT